MANVVVIGPTRETMTFNVIIRPTGAIAKFNAIVKIHKYKGLHEGHHFYFDGHRGARYTQT
jgi:hypothetical protein